MDDINRKFLLEDGRIKLVTYYKGMRMEAKDITDEIMLVVDDYLDEQLGFNDYKRVDGVVTYIGKDKDRYKK